MNCGLVSVGRGRLYLLEVWPVRLCVSVAVACASAAIVNVAVAVGL